MKWFLLWPMLLFLSCGPKDIGLVYARQYALRDANGVRQGWNEVLEQRGVQGRVVSVAIKRMRDDSGLWIYYILGESADGKLRMAQRIERRDKLFYASVPAAEIVLCTDCESGRVVWNAGWECENPFMDEGCTPTLLPAASLVWVR